MCSVFWGRVGRSGQGCSRLWKLLNASHVIGLGTEADNPGRDQSIIDHRVCYARRPNWEIMADSSCLTTIQTENPVGKPGWNPLGSDIFQGKPSIEKQRGVIHARPFVGAQPNRPRH